MDEWLLQNQGVSQEQIQAHRELQALTALFKTQLCKHHESTQSCSKGANCHFAHGAHELRKREDPLPPDLMMKMLNLPYNNLKTMLCKFWLKEGKCKFNKNCTFAHGEHELRKPYEAMPLKPPGDAYGQPEESKMPQSEHQQ